ncbi:hypothetical protein SUGI_0917500 [Cryptomeria japonica]|uniref:trypsin inhibitor BvTI n=1 Tax=Cryptomeria japonica TaxID=3369 RepID=UPI002414C987|nr:trypsin inhibitor BvTI [Cryptomeria japonica]GLJ44012.1 hypothetical protein SUGI_0917500 [Cryptomeria japonica]
MAIHWSSVILLSLAASMAVLSNGDERNAMLLDTEGHPLQAGLDYFILAAAGGKGRGFALTNTCPQYVVQDKSGEGLPVIFHPVCPGNASLFHRNTAVHVAISAPSICENNSGANVWSIARVSGINQTLVKITSGEGRSFMISKIGENEYGMFWCPAVICKRRFGVGPACKALAVHNDKQGNGWIVAGNLQPLRVQFKQAPAIVRV